MFDYIVQPGDTIFSITRLFNITTAQLLFVNPELREDGALYVGQTLRIPELRQVRPTIEVNGYADPTVSDEVLSSTLPFLTYLSILDYEVSADGTLSSVDGTRLIEAARQSGVAPLMVVSNIVPGVGFSGDLVHTLLSDARLYQTLIDNIIAILNEENYYGVNLNFTELYPGDYVAYTGFLQSLSTQLHPLGYILIVAPRIRVFVEEQVALLEANVRFPFNGIIDRLILRSTEWVCAYQQRAISFIDELQQAIDFAIQLISSPKILISIPSCCFDFRLSGQQSELDRLLSSAQADELVYETGGVFLIDPRSRTSHFTYVERDGAFHEVLCEIDTNFRAPIALVNTYNLGGVSFRNIDDYSVTSYQTVSAMFEIRKFITV